jgi:hypothetical protein
MDVWMEVHEVTGTLHDYANAPKNRQEENNSREMRKKATKERSSEGCIIREGSWAFCNSKTKV